MAVDKGPATRKLNDQKKPFVITKKLKNKIEQIRRISKENQLIYKEVSEKPITLFNKSEVKIKAGELEYCAVKPNYDENYKNKFRELLYVAKPTEIIKKNMDLQFIECLIDKDNLHVPIMNISSKDIILSKNKKLGIARQVQSEKLPLMDVDLTSSDSEICIIKEINKDNNNDNKEQHNNSENMNNREKEIIKFNNEMLTYPKEQAHFLQEFKDIFIPDDDYLLSSINIHPVRLATKSDIIVPTPTPARRNYSKTDIEAIDLFIEASMLNGLIRRCQSETVSPIHVVRHTDKKPRIVLDLRLVNKNNAAVFNYNYPHIEKEVRDLASGNFSYFFSADATAAFNQIPLDEESQKLLAFNCPTDKNKGVYCYTRLAFGWTSAPSVFASILDYILHGINQPHCNWKVKTFIDDIAGGACNYEDMKKLLRAFFTRLRRYNVKLSIEKSKFFTQNVEFCGLKITQNGYKMSDKRLRILKSYPDFDVSRMKKKDDLSLFGFYNYHRSFVKDYSRKDQIIRNTIKKWQNKTISTEDANKMIKLVTDNFKSEILSTVLVMPSKNDEIILETDSSGKSYGGFLYCERGIIAYFGSNHPITRQNSHNIYELELASLAYCIKQSFYYLSQCKSVCIKNDNISAIFSSNSIKTKLTSRVLKYLEMIQTLLSEIDNEIVHIKGTGNSMADLFSRLTYDEEGNIMITDNFPIEISPLGNQKQEEEPLSDREMLEHLHNNTHWSIHQTEKFLKLIDKNISNNLIRQVWRDCKSCGKYRKIGPYSKLNAHETATFPLEKLHIDHIDFKHNKSSRGHTGIFTARCDLTRFLFCFPCKTLGIQEVCKNLSTIMAITGRKIHSLYGDNAFNTEYLKNYCKDEKIELTFRPANSSRSCIVERAHRDIHEYLRRFEAEKSWDLYLHDVSRAMNDSICSSTGFTPRYLLYGSNQISSNEYHIKESQLYLNDLKLAKAISDSKRINDKFNFKIIKSGTPVMIRKDGHKNTKKLFGTVVKDDGGATIEVKLNSGNQYIYCKGHVYLIKGDEEYDRIFNPGTDISKKGES